MKVSAELDFLKKLKIFFLFLSCFFYDVNGDLQSSAALLGKSKNISTKKCEIDGKSCVIVPFQDVLASDSAKKESSVLAAKTTGKDFPIGAKNRPSRTDGQVKSSFDWSIDLQKSYSPMEIERIRSMSQQTENIQFQRNSDDQQTNENYDPYSPLVRCSFLPIEFLDCDEPVDLQGNQTAYEEQGYGCYKYGGLRWEDVQNSSAKCTVLPDIDCFGSRTFMRDGFPCVRFTGHYFLSTLLFSVLMGFLGLDRFCLGHTCLAVGKLMTLGGLGVWWLVDIVLLITGHLLPEDGSNWMPNY